MAKKRKIYHVVTNCKTVLDSFPAQGYEAVTFNALFYRNGKRLNSIENADTQYFAELVRNYDKSENPDKVKVEFRNSETIALLWSKEFNLADAITPEVTPVSSFQGFGEAEINEMVERKLSDYERVKEVEELRTRLDESLLRIEELEGELEEANAQLGAKKQVEYYANLLGMAMPGLAKMLGKTQAGQALGFLSGYEEPDPQDGVEDETTDSRTAILQMVSEYCESLDNTTLGKLYLVLCEFNSDGGLISRTLEFLTHKTQSHE